MTERIEKLLNTLRSGEYKKTRTDIEIDISRKVEGVGEYEFNILRLTESLKEEAPQIFEGDRFGFNRYHSKIYPVVIRNEKGEELPYHCWANGNMSPDVASVMKRGMGAILKEAKEKLASAEGETADFFSAVVMAIESVLNFAEAYRTEAKRVGCKELYTALSWIPYYPARNFYEACVFLKMVNMTLRLSNVNHIGFGRFDQYMLPYFEEDLKSGKTEEELFETLEEFFISLNFDSDIYGVVQAGDSGQTIMLGGYDKDGTDRFNRLSELCIKASTELCLIEPKINVRVNSTTPMERFELCTRLTEKGLGFPQYSNDDVVIPGLKKLGYGDDSYDYVTAACWEFIVQGKGNEIVNCGSVKFQCAVERAVLSHLCDCEAFEDIYKYFDEEIENEFQRIDAHMRKNPERYRVSSYLSIFTDDCMGRGKDCRRGGAKYVNFGVHGTGISVAADSLAAVKKAVFEDKVCTAEELVRAMKADFSGFEELQKYLKACPKMGNNDDFVDSIAVKIMDMAGKRVNGRPNWRGGIYRLGTGTANGYRWADTGAMPNGDNKDAGLGANYSPAITTRIKSPTTVIQSFTKPDMTNAINGGPLTLELHDSAFTAEDGIKKVAALVKTFIDLGGHQLQLNSINRDTLLDAQKNPEQYKGLIVRVWGWSGYFVELDKGYQDHVIKRTEYTV